VKSEPVVPEKGTPEPDLGCFDPGQREITVNTAACVHTQISSLFHEMTHLALWDSAAMHSLTDQQQEIVCDALGNYLAAAALAGCIIIRAPKE
jgi:hypothetical protein